MRVLAFRKCLNKGKPERSARKCHNSYLGGQRGSAGKNGSANWFRPFSNKWSGERFAGSERTFARASQEISPVPLTSYLADSCTPPKEPQSRVRPDVRRLGVYNARALSHCTQKSNRTPKMSKRLDKIQYP